MAALLVAQPIAQRLHQLLEPAERRDLGLFLGGEEFFGLFFQPVCGQVHRFEHLRDAHRLKPAERLGEGTIEPVDMALVLHHGGAGEVIEPFHVIGHEPRAHGLQKGEVFAQADRNAGLAEVV